MKFELYCLCGDECIGEMHEKKFDDLISIWRLLHQGEGHGDTDRKTCRRIADKKEAAEEERLVG